MAEGASADQADRGTLIALVVLTQVIGILILILLGVWIADYLGGFAWSGKEQFNYHPLFMVLGLVYLYGTSSILYRLFPNASKFKVKILHATLHGIAIVFVIAGLVAVFEFHNAFKIPNLYTLHSWVGILTVVIYGLQYIIGFVTFLFPGSHESVRAWFLPQHRYVGFGILILAGSAAVSGLTEKIIFTLGNTYQILPPAGLLPNLCGILIIVFLLLVLYILNKDEWKRRETDESLRLVGTDEEIRQH